MSRPLFLSLDGIDGTGKSTQCRLLVEWLRSRGFTVTSCADPGGTSLGKAVRDLLLHHRQEMSKTSEALLFMASRAQLAASVIRPALEAAQIVVSDRFLLANVAYQGHGAGLNPERLWEIEHFATGGLEPDLTLVLDLPLELALARRNRPADRIESRDADYQERVRQGFLTEARLHPDKIRIVDARPGVAAVQQALRDEVLRLENQRTIADSSAG